MWRLTLDIWHVTCDTSHLTHDMWHVVEGEHSFKLQLTSSLGLWIMMVWRFGGKGSHNQLIIYKGVCRTAVATPGMLNMEKLGIELVKWWSQHTVKVSCSGAFMSSFHMSPHVCIPAGILHQTSNTIVAAFGKYFDHWFQTWKQCQESTFSLS